MIKQDADGTPFHSPTVKKALCRIRMEKIRSYQSERRSFYQSRTHTARTEILPISASRFVESIGDLDVRTGIFYAKDPVIAILDEFKEWTDFNVPNPST